MRYNRRERRKLEIDIQNKGGFSYTNVETGTQLQYEPDTKSEIDPSIDETEVERLTNYLIAVSEENEEADEYGVKFYEYKRLTFSEYVLLIMAKKINMNIKTNRPDINKKLKKQGIIATLWKGNCLPCFCLCIRVIDGVLCILVNDGGHRSRTFVEFIQDGFRTSAKTYYTNSNGKKINIGNLLFSEIEAQHPKIADKFKAVKQKFDVYHHISPKEMTEEFQDRNQSSDTNFQEGEVNCHDFNLFSTSVRNIDRIVEGEDSNPHALFRTIDGEVTIGDDALCGFGMKRLNWETMVSRLMCMLDNIDSNTPSAEEEEILELVEAGCGIEGGRFTKSLTVFEKLENDRDRFLTYASETMRNWNTPKRAVKKEIKLMVAIFRFFFHLEYHYFNQKFYSDDYPHGYKFYGVKDYSKFARKFGKLMATIYNKDDVDNPEEFGRWIEGGKKGKGRTISNAFKGYLNHYNDPNRYQQTLIWMFDEFDEDFEAWGLDVRDAERNIPEKILRSRLVESDQKCECCDRLIDDEKIKLEGAHNIPHSAGVQAGGCSGTKENARASCFDCNRDMKERVFDEYKESGDWKKFLT